MTDRETREETRKKFEVEELEVEEELEDVAGGVPCATDCQQCGGDPPPQQET